MGFNVLKTSPVSCSSRTFSSVLSNLNFIHSPTTTRLFTNRLNSLAPSLLKLKPLTVTGTGCISSSGFYRSLRFEQNKRSFRGGVVLAVASGPASVNKSEEEWRAILSPEQFRILRQKATEYPDTGEYDKHFEEGIYNCSACGTPLYKSTTKFNSGCGWPAFYEGLPGAINCSPDPDGLRIEITCAACGGHLGHVFKGEGFPTPTDERHCVNSISLKFVPANSGSSM
ncbi:peptide methionine sulfoxide reductase B2 [Citrus sinensis]|uniref:Peptide-methionine (R)-S-oxide reductase n=3 Tax=Citrus TaxID=2706 RepID=V4RNI7_CITCL|nr:hypothetical protein CICLE_v10029224mg [Citrus x clementina]KAH9655309.1 peptide methionine sulfoxide reductase B2 [Citrus sinensis]